MSILSDVRAHRGVEAAHTAAVAGRLDAVRGIPLYLLVVAAFDALMIAAALGVAHVGRFGDRSPTVTAKPGMLDALSYTSVGVVIWLVWLVCLFGAGSYDRRIVGLGTEEYRRVFVGSFRAAGIVAIACFLAGVEVARGYLAIAVPLGTTALLVDRFVARRWLQRQRATGRMCHRVLVVGGREHVLDLVRQLESHKGSGFSVVGACLTTSANQLREEDASRCGARWPMCARPSTSPARTPSW